MPMATHEHAIDLTVQIFDTDCYGVMWHGAYVKWLEMGRVEWLRAAGILCYPPGAAESDGWIYPVVDQHFKFTAPARLNDPLRLVTTLTLDEPRLIFTQRFEHRDTGKATMEATTINVVLDAAWKVQRRIPATLLLRLEAHGAGRTLPA